MQLIIGAIINMKEKLELTLDIYVIPKGQYDDRSNVTHRMHKYSSANLFYAKIAAYIGSDDKYHVIKHRDGGGFGFPTLENKEEFEKYCFAHLL